MRVLCDIEKRLDIFAQHAECLQSVSSLSLSPRNGLGGLIEQSTSRRCFGLLSRHVKTSPLGLITKMQCQKSGVNAVLLLGGK